VQTGDIGQVALVPPGFDGSGCHALIIIRTDPRIVTGDFLDLVLRSRYGYESLKRVQTGALHPHLNCTWVREIAVPIPPASEQAEILSCMRAASSRCDHAIEAAQREIGLLGEYYGRLVNDVVTGKLDAREAAAVLPEIDPQVADDEPDDAFDPGSEVSLGNLDSTLEEVDS